MMYSKVWDLIAKGLHFVVMERLEYGWVHALWKIGEKVSVCMFEDAVLRWDELPSELERYWYYGDCSVQSTGSIHGV